MDFCFKMFTAFLKETIRSLYVQILIINISGYDGITGIRFTTQPWTTRKPHA